MTIQPAATAPADLLLAVQTAGARVQIRGGRVEYRPARGLSPELRAQLQAQHHAIWRHLGGDALDEPPIALLQQLNVALLIPDTTKEAADALAWIEADPEQQTLIGLDIETAALPGTETRPPIKLRKDGEPAKTQPSFTSTAALDPHRSRIRLVQLYAGGSHAVILDTDKLPLDLIAPLLSRRTAVIHNAAFELRFLNAAGIAVPQHEDTMQAAGLLLGVRQRSLEAAAGAYLDIELPKTLQLSDWSAPVLSRGQYAYAALDAIVAFRLWAKLHPELIQKGREVAYQLQRDVTRVVVAMVDRGITLDRGRHQQQIDEWRTTLASATREFQQQAGQLPPDTPEQTRDYLRKVLPADILASWQTTAKTGAMSTKAAELRRVTTVPAIRSLLDIKATEKLLSSFGDDLLDKISRKTGRLHPGLNIGSTKAGRSSAANPNVQQMPKHKAPLLRSAFIAAPGYKLVLGDFGTMELRAFAEVSDDSTMRQDFADGVDFHRQRSAGMLGITEDEVTKSQRDAAKPINFGTIYGAGARGLVANAWNSYGVMLTVEEAEAGRQHFLRRYATAARWMREHYVRCGNAGRIDIGIFGRVIEAAWETAAKPGSRRTYRHYEDDDGDEDDSEFFDAWVSGGGWASDQLKYTLCCNAPVQGACADIGMLTLLLCDAALRQESIDGGLVLFIHDEIVVEVRTDQAERAAELLRTAMEQAFLAVFPNAPLTGLTDISISDTWGKE